MVWSQPFLAFSYEKWLAKPIRNENRSTSESHRKNISLELRHNILVDEDDITLTDLAECQGARLVCEEARGLIIAETPLASTKGVVISRKAIEEIVSLEWPNTQIAFKGATEVTVRVHTVTLTSHEVKQAFDNFLEKGTTEEFGQRVRCQSLQLQRPLRVRKGPYKLLFPDLELLTGPNSSGSRGVQKLRVVHTPLGSAVGTTEAIAFVRLQVEKKALVSLNYLPMGTRLDRGDFKVSWVREDVPSLKSMLQLVEGQELYLKKTINKGQALSKNYLERRKLVSAGDRVSLEIKGNGLQISAIGRARKSGARGDKVVVFLPSTGKLVEGKIIGEKRVLSTF